MPWIILVGIFLLLLGFSAKFFLGGVNEKSKYVYRVLGAFLLIYVLIALLIERWMPKIPPIN